MSAVLRLTFACIFCYIRHGETTVNKAWNQVVRNDTDGTVLCASDTPAVTSQIHTQLECSNRCLHDYWCASFNYRKETNSRPKPLCELFHYWPHSFTTVTDCSHYQVCIMCDDTVLFWLAYHSFLSGLLFCDRQQLKLEN